MRSVAARLAAYTELSTKLATVLPFTVAVLYCLYLTGAINVQSTALFFFAMLLFDMGVTMINNYIDRRAANKADYFSGPVMLTLIYLAIIPAGIIGIVLSYTHGIVFLLAGIFCFAVGIAYTYGPFPISRSPYGEFFSGFTIGFVLPFLVITINAPGIVTPVLDGWDLGIAVDVYRLLGAAFVCAPLVLCVSNILLANNICDMEADKASRYTMARHVGTRNALGIFTAVYVFVYAAIVAACILRFLPFTALAVLPTAVPVFINVKKFREKQVKAETFVLSIKCFLLILVPYALSLAAGFLLAGFTGI